MTDSPHCTDLTDAEWSLIEPLLPAWPPGNAAGQDLRLVINGIFFHSVGASLVTSIVVVLLFSGVTAYETQMIKEMYYEGDAPGIAKGKSIFGAFALYGSFITLFVHILNILGIMNRN